SNDAPAFVPENLTWNIQLDQVVTPRLRLRANLIDSETENIYIVNPEAGRKCPGVVVLRSMGRSNYRAFELTGRFSPKEKGPNAFYVSYMRSRSLADLNNYNDYFGDFASPVIRPTQFSRSAMDVPHRLLAWGALALPRRVSLAPVFEIRSG